MALAEGTLKWWCILFGAGVLTLYLLPALDGILLGQRFMPKVYRIFYASRFLYFLLSVEERRDPQRAVQCGRRLYLWNLLLMTLVELCLAGAYLLHVF